MTSIDTAEDTPGLPNFLNRNHPNWRTTMKPGPKETALREQRKGPEASAKVSDVTNISMAELNMTPPKTNGRAAPVATAKPEAKPQTKQETTVKTKQKKTSSTKARTRVKAGAKTKAAKTNGSVRPGSKLETIVGLLKRPEGCTTKDVLKATGWPAVSMPQQAKAAGLTLKKEKDGPVTRYRAA